MYVIRAGSVMGAIVALFGVLHIWRDAGLPTVAWSSDLVQVQSSVNDLARQQLDTAQEVYQQKLDSLTVLGTKLKTAPDVTPHEKGLVDKEILDTQHMLDDLRNRKIELSK